MLVPGSDQEEQDVIEDNEDELDQESDPPDDQPQPVPTDVDQ